MKGSKTAEVLAVSVTHGKGATDKEPGVIVLDENGVVGDMRAGRDDRQVSVLPIEVIEHIAAETGCDMGPGSFAENVTTRGLDLASLQQGDHLVIGEVRLEVTLASKRARGEVCSLHGPVERFVMRQDGVFCRVVTGGQLRPGDAILTERA